MPELHRALTCQTLSADFSGLQFRDLTTPQPGPGELLIAIRAAALNFPDLLMSDGKYQFKPELPFIPGMEAAGEVLSADPGSGFAQGDRVYFGCRTGALSQRIVMPASKVNLIPEGFDFAQAAAWRVGALTGYVALVRRGALARGETLLVHGASGGMGMAAVQLGKHLGARVLATGSDPHKLAVVKAVGADQVILLGERAGAGHAGFRDRVKELTSGLGADVIYDPVGGDVFDESTRCIAWGGRLLIIGFTSGRIATISTNIALIKGFSVVGVRAGETGRRNPAQGLANEQAVAELARSGVMKPHIGARFPFEQSLAALAALRDRRFAGKIVVEMND